MKTNSFFTTSDHLTLAFKRHIPSRAASASSFISKLFLACLGFLIVSITPAYASDPIGIFAIVDKVVFEPDDQKPERAQLWGTFSLADEKNPADYKAPKAGYLYFKLPAEKSEVALKEWKDLQKQAGQGEIIGFGSRYEAKGSIRNQDQRPENPEPYPVAFGLVKQPRRPSNYPPIQRLRAAHQKNSSPSTSEQKKDQVSSTAGKTSDSLSQSK